MTLVLGIEGTAWAASAAIFQPETDDVFIESEFYRPESGGIHPREAAEHMRTAIPNVVETALTHARTTFPRSPDEPPIDAVAFSQGPGLGPCLRIAGTAARALAGMLDVPLVGVNHMVGHLEIGRHRSGFDAPICLNASGANAHLLGYRRGRYRVLGETMDTGVGNALDKFTRHVGWSHPGGPKVEAHAKGGEYVDLPYVVKGMDFSFSGIMSAAKEASDDGVPVEDICYSLQENVFAMLTEVSERALSLTGATELVLGGGVGQNDRLREMLRVMCEQRGAQFFAPEARFLRDNAGMIAVLGSKMYDAGETLEISDSQVRPEYRPDQVDVTWHVGTPPGDERDEGRTIRGAEAVVTVDDDRVVKERRPKEYRHPTLDRRLRSERTRSEARLTSEARRHGVPTPVVYDVDPENGTLVFEHVGTADLRAALSAHRVRSVGHHLARLHAAGFVHGDPTTRNIRVGESRGGENDRTYLIDFGLGYYTDDIEDYAMDLHVFAQSLAGTADDAEFLRRACEESYTESGDSSVLSQLREIEGRGRYQ